MIRLCTTGTVYEVGVLSISNNCKNTSFNNISMRLSDPITWCYIFINKQIFFLFTKFLNNNLKNNYKLKANETLNENKTSLNIVVSKNIRVYHVSLSQFLPIEI